MLVIDHRVNSTINLQNLIADGVELDLRYHNSDIILHHDPFQPGEKFEYFLKKYRLKFIILNIKSEGIEEEVLRLVQKHEVKDYFFLDSSIPFMVKYINKGWTKFAVRFSEYEPLEFALKFKNKVEWVWVDCFNDLPLNEKSYLELKKNFKICLVSPELQGHPLSMIEDFKKQLNGFQIDAVCTKRPDLWKN
tara:strand:- start:3972 stop:4547 length:576 start_codon:yes stop_codon:yes gene_type:complete